MAIFDKNRKIWSCDTLFLSKSIAFNNSIGFVKKFYPCWHLAVKIIFFKNFKNDVIMTGSDQSPRFPARTYSIVDYLVLWAKNKIVRVSLKLNFIPRYQQSADCVPQHAKMDQLIFPALALVLVEFSTSTILVTKNRLGIYLERPTAYHMSFMKQFYGMDQNLFMIID